ncbi:MAG: O-antigen ligase family protein [Desulfobacterales bacterium]|nr:O-antigen ligase family protein [Desulfobacterales bacterium]
MACKRSNSREKGLSMLPNARLQTVIPWLVLIFPAAALLVEHSSSIFLVLFAVSGIAASIKSDRRASLSLMEKCLLWAFVLFPASYLLSFTIHFLQGDLLDPRFKYLDDEFRMVLMIPIFLLFRQVRVPQFHLWNGIVIGAVAAGANAFLRFFWLAPGERVSGSYDAIAVGDISLSLAVMSVASWGFLMKRNPHYRWLIPAAFLFGMASTVLSETRGAWVAIPALMLILFFFMGRYWSLLTRLSMAGLCVIFAAVVYLVPATNVAKRVQEVKQEIQHHQEGNAIYGGATFRMLGVKATAALFPEHPIIGIGPGNYKPLVKQRIAEGELHELTAMHSNPGSTFLGTLVDCGLVGLLSLIGIFVVPFWISIFFIRRHTDRLRNMGYALLMLVVSMFHFGQFEAIFRRSFFTNFYIVMIAALAAIAFRELADHDPAAGTPKKP